MLGIPAEPLRGRSGRLERSSAVAGGVEAIKTVSAENLSAQEISRLLARPRIDFSSILKTVRRWGASRGRASPAVLPVQCACLQQRVCWGRGAPVFARDGGTTRALRRRRAAPSAWARAAAAPAHPAWLPPP